MDTFRKWQNEVIAGFNKNNWLAVDVSNVCHGSSERYVNSWCLVGLIDNQVRAIGRLNQTIHNATKVLNNMSIKIGDMWRDLQKHIRAMEYYASKLHLVEKSVEVSNIFCLCKHIIFILPQLKQCNCNCYAFSCAANTFLYGR